MTYDPQDDWTLVTWNIGGLRSNMDRILAYVKTCRPTVMLLQEILVG